ncbi:MAG: VIT domain-containing protein [Phycisphaerae bacterium]
MKYAWMMWLGLVMVVTSCWLAACETKYEHDTLPLSIDRPLAPLHETYSNLGTTSSSGKEISAARPGIPGAAPADHEELWIIKKAPEPAAAPATSDELPGTGALLVKGKDDAAKPIPVPLKHTDVRASIAGYIATVEVTQQFQNPFSEKIEAVYVFPLPHDAGINEFVMTVGDRHIRGLIRERGEAEKIYKEAKAQGYVASLLTQERPNIFTQRVDNIEPGKQIDIQIIYFNTLAYADGWYEFVFPMVVGPRYNPAGTTDGVGAVARDAHGISGQKTEVSYLRPGERSGHDISLAVDLDPGVSIEGLRCPSHGVTVKNISDHQAQVALAERDVIPNKDFVLRYKVAGKSVKSALVLHTDKRGGFFTLMLFPPESLQSLPRRGVEMVFVIDSSGSMNGQPIAQAKAAVLCALDRLELGDTFQVVNFASSAEQMASSPLAVNQKNVAAARRYINNLNGAGGTEMLQGINAALNFPHDPERTRVVVFLTDGYIGNEAQIVAALHDQLLESRVFSFGVGSSVNRHLLDSMAKVGRGAVAYLGLNDDAAPVMDAYFQRISHPALADLQIDWAGLKVDSTFPGRLPDLYVGRPVVLTGKFTGQVTGPLHVRGKVGNEVLDFTIPVAPPVDHPALPVIWARMKIADLYDRLAWEPKNNDLMPDIKNTALEYGIMSPYTAFLAVDSLTRTAGTHGTTVAVPVAVPDGVRYDTTVQDPKLQGTGEHGGAR